MALYRRAARRHPRSRVTLLILNTRPAHARWITSSVKHCLWRSSRIHRTVVTYVTLDSTASLCCCVHDSPGTEQRRGAPPTTLFTASAIKPSQVKSQYFINTPVQHTDTDTSSLIFLQIVSHLSVCDAAGGTLGCVLLPGNRGLCLQTANGKSYRSCRYVTLRGRLSTVTINFISHNKFHDFS